MQMAVFGASSSFDDREGEPALHLIADLGDQNLGIPRQLKDAASAPHSAKAESSDISIAYASGVSIML
jgi:hypothetical protein